MIFASVHSVIGYNILFLTPFNGKSHWILMETIIEALLDRQHHVTTITSFAWNGAKPANYTEILIDPPLDFESYSKQYFNLAKICYLKFITHKVRLNLLNFVI